MVRENEHQLGPASMTEQKTVRESLPDSLLPWVGLEAR
jgi:hypothetical protein